jgi:hypothetical protein
MWLATHRYDRRIIISAAEVLIGAVGELPILQNKQSEKDETFSIVSKMN